MTPDASRHMVVGGVLIAGTLTVVNDITHGRTPQIRTALGVIVAGVLLSVLAGPAPDLAGALGALVAVAAVLSTGSQALAPITKGLTS